MAERKAEREDGLAAHLNAIADQGYTVIEDAFDPDLMNATSLKIESGRSFVLNECLEQLCQVLSKWISLLDSASFNMIDEHYLQQLYGYRETLEFSDAKDENLL